jgi:hypothetical protein
LEESFEVAQFARNCGSVWSGISKEASRLQNGSLLFAEVKGIKIYQVVAASYLKDLIA